MKLGQMEQRTFEALRDEIIGEDVKDVHLVKGLDYKLLERVRKGEDVLSDTAKSTELENPEEEREDKPKVDVDDEFEMMEGKEIQPVAKEEKIKKGEMAPPAPVAGQKRTRDDILKELKASRAAAAEKAKESQLGSRFQKIGGKKERSRIEKDARGNEILITVDEDGNVKRKIKKAKAEEESDSLLMPDKDAKPLGMEVPAVASALVEEDDGDIFEGVGVDYNPLGDIEDDDDDDSSDEEATAPNEPSKLSPPPKPSESETSSMPPPAKRKRNYFDEPEEDGSPEQAPRNPLTDPNILAALKKAATLEPITAFASSEKEAAKLARRKMMLESDDRDAQDMDMEFGSSRFGDQDDGEDKRVKLSKWTGGGDADEGDEREEAKAKRKRGAKKRKGDVNSAADVLRVMERRKGEGK